MPGSPGPPWPHLPAGAWPCRPLLSPPRRHFPNVCPAGQRTCIFLAPATHESLLGNSTEALKIAVVRPEESSCPRSLLSITVRPRSSPAPNPDPGKWCFAMHAHGCQGRHLARGVTRCRAPRVPKELGGGPHHVCLRTLHISCVGFSSAKCLAPAGDPRSPPGREGPPSVSLNMSAPDSGLLLDRQRRHPGHP